MNTRLLLTKMKNYNIFSFTFICTFSNVVSSVMAVLNFLTGQGLADIFRYVSEEFLHSLHDCHYTGGVHTPLYEP